jgi:hypothetical protein
MANVSTTALRSKLAHRNADSSGPSGMPHNAQDFSDLVGQRAASAQEYLRRHWEYLPDHRRARAARMSTTFKGVAIDPRTGQFGLGI